MKDTTIFALLLLVFTLSALLAARDTSRTAIVRGSFAPEFTNVNWKWAYLHPAGSDDILDSCLITEHRFTLSSDIPESDYPCRISFSRVPIEPSLHLSPRQTLELHISAGMRQELAEQHAEAVREAIARLDSTGLTLPDSLCEERQRSEKKGM